MSLNNDRRIGRRLPPYLEKNTSTFKYDPGPYIGVIKDNRDPTRSGRLRIWIPDFGGDEDNPNNWRTVWWASPFLGTTSQKNDDGWANGENSFGRVQHSYGMWFPVPDLNNLVLCIFVAGDPNRGFWFGCVLNQLGHHMVPAIGGSDRVDFASIEDSTVKSLVEDGEFYPVAEFNEFQRADKLNWSDFVNAKKPLHEPQTKILIEQGLDRTRLTGNRGTIKTTSQRETPSSSFGFVSPGRPYKQPWPDSKDPESKRTIKARQGGHSFVMDDGDSKGLSTLTRWRSAGGHQILLDDQEKIMYVGNSNGSVWIELTNGGHLNIYTSDSINMRTKQDFNLHVDRDFNLDVGGQVNIRAKNDLRLQSGQRITARASGEMKLFAGELRVGSDGAIDIYTPTNASITVEKKLKLFAEDKLLLNSGRGPEVERPGDLAIKSLPDTEKQNSKWVVKADRIKSVAKIVPTHEPWPRRSGTSSNSSNAAQDTGSDDQSITATDPPESAASDVARDSQGDIIRDSSGNPIRTLPPTDSSDPGLVTAGSVPLSRGAPDSVLKRSTAPDPASGIGSLSKEQTRGLLAQIAYSESEGSGDYQAVNSGGYVGRYQMGAAALVESGYISKAAYEQYGGAKGGNRVLDDPNAWTGKGGVASKDDFLNSPSAQESAMITNTTNNYNRMVKSGAIKPEDDASTVGGMLQTAHLLGANGAKNWRENGTGQDANGTTGATYFNRGRYAVDNLGGRA